MTPEFFKVFLPQTSSHRLLIPPAFRKHVKNSAPLAFTIVSPDGQEWAMELEREGGNLYLKKGWHQFVNYHSLEYGDFLIFRYDGSSCFCVKVFGKNGCRKEINPARISNGPRLDDEGAELKTDMKRKRGRPRKEPVEVVQMREGRLLAVGKCNPAVSAANKFSSNYPMFKIFLSEGYIRRRKMVIPTGFASVYMKESSLEIHLQAASRLWTVRLVRYKARSQCEFSVGWPEFVQENNLKAGDVCLFELVELAPLTLKVSMFRC